MNDMKSGRFELESPMLDRVAVCELNDDFTLPDYMPPIGRVISIEGCAAPPSRYVGAGIAEFAGAVRYRLLYEGLGDGENGGNGSNSTSGSVGNYRNGGVWCAELVSEYDAQMRPDTGDTSDGGEFRTDQSEFVTVADASTENVSARVTAPRRVTLRCRVRVRGRLLGRKEYDCMVRGNAPEDGIRRLDGNGRAGVTVSGVSEPVSLHDTITFDELPAGGDGELRVVGCRGEVFISDAASEGDGAVCRGELCMRILLCREGEGERPFTVTRRIPLSANAVYDTAFPDGTQPVGVRAWGECTAASAAVEENALVCEAVAEVFAESAGVCNFSYIRDIYSCDVNCEVARRDIRVNRPLACLNANITVSGDENMKTLGGDNGMKLTDVRATAIAEPTVTVDTEKSDVSISGKLKCIVLLENGSELEAKEFEIPYRYSADVPELRSLGAGNDTVNAEVRVCACSCRGRIDGDRVAVDCELSLAIRLSSFSSVSAVSEVNYGGLRRGSSGTVSRPARITVCYPSDGESLWSVAKRYGADFRAVASDNGIDPSIQPDSAASLSGVDFLII